MIFFKKLHNKFFLLPLIQGLECDIADLKSRLRLESDYRELICKKLGLVSTLNDSNMPATPIVYTKEEYDKILKVKLPSPQRRKLNAALNFPDRDIAGINQARYTPFTWYEMPSMKKVTDK
jgi:hypothetical protein